MIGLFLKHTMFSFGKKKDFVFFLFKAQHHICHRQSKEAMKVTELKSATVSWALRGEGNLIQAVN